MIVVASWEMLGTTVAAISLVGGAVWTAFKRKNKRDEKFEDIEKKINILGEGMRALIRREDGLDEKRFEEALTQNGFRAEDLRKEEE